MSKRPAPVIVFADADATSAAREPGRADRLAGALELLAARRITLVLCSRRTRAEVESIRQALGIFHPFVCERGAVAYVPERYFGTDLEDTRRVGGYQAIEFGSPYEQVLGRLHRAAGRLNLEVVGFNDMSVDQVARECGLPLLEARLAKLREYSEPFRLVSPNPVAEWRLMKALDSAGLTCVPFGAFQQVASVPGPGAAAPVLTTLYRVALGAVVTASAGGAAWSVEIGGRVDVKLDRPAPDAAEWFESIVRSIDNIRDAGLSRPASRYAR